MVYQRQSGDFLWKKTDSVSKQAFCEARKKIKPEAFIKLFDTIVDWNYKENPCKKFLKFCIFAIDVSIIEINNSIRLRDAFCVSKGSGSLVLARAMASCIYDIENNLIVKAFITKCTDSERSVAIKLINSLKPHLSSDDLFLSDRGYPSLDFFSYLIELKVKFIIRIPKSNYNCTIKASVPDQVIEFKKHGKVMHLRAIQFTLSSDEIELLITNVDDEKLGVENFKTLYFKRGIEQSLTN